MAEGERTPKESRPEATVPSQGETEAAGWAETKVESARERMSA